ncbi:Peptidase C1A [Theobroma cacao]|nr:Peptidase C1A [Theobroma cacao]
MDNAFEYIVQNQGIAKDITYPYKVANRTCDLNQASVPAHRITSYEDVPANNEEALLKAASNQPVSVVLDAAGPTFRFYSKGVFDGECGTKVNHAVTIVGYGTSEDGANYWLIKNLWGEKWGEEK